MNKRTNKLPSIDGRNEPKGIITIGSKADKEYIRRLRQKEWHPINPAEHYIIDLKDSESVGFRKIMYIGVYRKGLLKLASKYA